MRITRKFRIKDSTSRKQLCQLAGAVNYIWNYINDLSHKNIKQYDRFLSEFDINNYLSGGSKEIPILHSDTFQEISRFYITARNEFRHRLLHWRSAKRSLGWIPFKARSVQLHEDYVIYRGNTFRFYKSRAIDGTIKTGSFNQDSRGRWYINLVCEVADDLYKIKKFPDKEIGIDLGVTTKLSLSNGKEYSRENLTKKYENKLAHAQRAGHKRQTKNIHAKIKNSRNDFNHKVTTEICKTYENIYVGDINIIPLIEQAPKGLRKSLLDSSLYDIKCYLKYKAKKLGNTYKEVNEAFTTMKCNTCGALTGPHGLKDLSIREWTCNECGAFHKRDISSATAILRIGHDSP